MRTNIFRPTRQKADFANQLRRSLTPAEEALWKVLQQINIGSKEHPARPWHSQVVVKGWIVDFYNHHRLLGLEVDGGIHDTQSQWEKDQLKDSVLMRMGIRIIRIPNRVALSKYLVIQEYVRDHRNSNSHIAELIAGLEEFS